MFFFYRHDENLKEDYNCRRCSASSLHPGSTPGISTKIMKQPESQLETLAQFEHGFRGVFDACARVHAVSITYYNKGASVRNLSEEERELAKEEVDRLTGVMAAMALKAYKVFNVSEVTGVLEEVFVGSRYTPVFSKFWTLVGELSALSVESLDEIVGIEPLWPAKEVVDLAIKEPGGHVVTSLRGEISSGAGALTQVEREVTL